MAAQIDEDLSEGMKSLSYSTPLNDSEKMTAGIKVLHSLSTASGMNFLSPLMETAQIYSPDEKQQAIINELKNLLEETVDLGRDVRKMQEVIVKTGVVASFTEMVGVIIECITLSNNILQAKDNAGKTHLKQKLLLHEKELDSKLGELFKNVDPASGVQDKILETVYSESKGSRPKVVYLARLVLQLIFGGFFASITLTYAKSKDLVPLLFERYRDRLNSIGDHVNHWVRKCEIENDFRNFIYDDVMNILSFQDDVSTEPLSERILTALTEKYDFLYFFIAVIRHPTSVRLVCDYIDVDAVDKSAYVYYRFKTEQPKKNIGSRWKKVTDVSKALGMFSDADSIIDTLQQRYGEGGVYKISDYWMLGIFNFDSAVAIRHNWPGEMLTFDGWHFKIITVLT